MWRAIITWAAMPLFLLFLPVAVLALERPAAPSLEPSALVGRALRPGDRGEAVSALQEALESAGFSPGKIDGIFGPLTEGAVRQAQRRLGLEVDGKAGARTVTALAGPPAAAETGETAVPASGGRLTVSTDPGAAADAGKPRAPSAQLIVHQPAAPAAVPVAEAESVAPAVSSGGRFALTFNGEPDPVLLPRLLQTLQKHGAHATFFVTADAAARQPELIRSIAGQGHAVGTMGSGDLDPRRVAPAMLETRLRQSQRAIAQVTGAEPAYFRPPGGMVSTVLAESALRVGMAPVMWTNVTVTDAPGVTPAALARRMEGVLFDGAVLMLHQDRPATVVAVDLLLQRLADAGWRSEALSNPAN